jgi:3D (Asp-Asp-Asp) domain-containing protein
MRRLVVLLLVCCLGALQGDARPHTLPVTVTAYSYSGQRTASGAWPQVGYCALSHDLETSLGLAFGARVHIEGVGTCVFTDRMHRRWQHRVDLFLPSHGAAVRFGIRHQVPLSVL